MAEACAELPRYKCHKKVHAIKIDKVEPSCGNRPAGPNDETDGGGIITPDKKEGFAPFKVSPEWMHRFNDRGPNVPVDDPGYFVVYENGFTSWSPTEAFEGGYTREG